MSGGVFDVVVDGCKFGDPFGRVWKAGVMIKTAAGRGGVVSNITVKNSFFYPMDRDPSGAPGMSALSVNMFYPNDEVDDRLMAGDPVFRRIHFENISISCGSWCQYTGSFLGTTRSTIG